MKILVDADSCNKINSIIKIGKEYELEVHLFYDFNHDYESLEDCIKHEVIKGPDSSDYAIIAFCKKEDIVITKDGGLAAMVLAKGGFALNTSGMEYNDSNMLSILTSRHLNKKERMKGYIIKSRTGKSPNYKKYNFKETLVNIIKRKEKINES